MKHNKENRMLLAKQRGSRVKLARQLTGMAKAVLIEKYHLKKHAFDCWEVGKILLTFEDAQILSNIFNDLGVNITSDWLLTGQTNDMSPIMLNPLVQKQNNAQETAEILSTSHSTNDQSTKSTTPTKPIFNKNLTIIDEVNFFKNSYPDAEITIVQDNALSPFYKKGDYVGGRYSTDKTYLSLVGQICIIFCDNNHLITRKIFKYCGNSMFLVGATMPLEIDEPIQEIQIIKAAPITRHWIMS